MTQPLQLLTADFETFYSDEYSLTKLTTEAYIRDPRFQVIGVSVKVGNGKTEWFSGTYEEIKNFLQKFDWDNVGLIAQNTAFDAAILSWHFGIRPRFLFDTMSMGRPFYALRGGVSLFNLARVLEVGEKGNEVIHAKGKRREDFTPEELELYGRYCDNDAELTYRVFKKLLKRFPQSELLIIDVMLRMFTEPKLVLDASMLRQHLVDVRAEKERLLEAVGLCNRDVIMSAAKFAELLMAEGVEPPTKPSPSNPEKRILALAKTDILFKDLLEHPSVRVQALVAARLGLKSTLEETRTEAFLRISERGTLPILLNYYGGHTGRASGGDKINLQNLTRGGKLRLSICAPPGHSLVVGDSAQIEARVVAWLAEQDDLIAAFARRDDIYSAFASEMYGKPVQKGDLERQPGKIAILGLGFGMGYVKYRNTLKVLTGIEINESEAKNTVNFYRKKYTKIKVLWDRCSEALATMVTSPETEFHIARGVYAKGDKIYLPNGLFLYYPELQHRDGQYSYMQRAKVIKLYGGKLVENIVQALARIVVFDQMVLMSKHYPMALSVHDENVAIVPDNEAKSAGELMDKIMRVVPPWAEGLPVDCEINVAKRYGEAK